LTSKGIDENKYNQRKKGETTMEAVQQKITPNKVFSGHENYRKLKLEEIFTEIISKTSSADIGFRIEPEDYSDSTVTHRSTKIHVARYNKSRSMIPVVIQLENLCEKWLFSIYLKKGVQSNAQEFHKEVRDAAAAFCEKEKAVKQKRKDLLLSKEQQKPNLPIERKAESSDIGEKKESVVVVVSQEKKKRKKFRRASSVMNDELVLEILQAWMKRSSGLKIIDQKEFWKILQDLGITISRVSVLRFLEKREIVKVSVPGERRLNWKQKKENSNEKLSSFLKKSCLHWKNLKNCDCCKSKSRRRWSRKRKRSKKSKSSGSN